MLLRSIKTTHFLITYLLSDRLTQGFIDDREPGGVDICHSRHHEQDLSLPQSWEKYQLKQFSAEDDVAPIAET
jgi:hypothetical protein